LDQRYNKQLPPYYTYNYDDLFLQASKLMVGAIIPLQGSTEVDALLLEVDNPDHFCKLAQHAQSFKKRSDIVLRCGEKCQVRIKLLDDARILLRPIQKQRKTFYLSNFFFFLKTQFLVDDLKREQSELAAKHIHLSVEKLEQLKYFFGRGISKASKVAFLM